jgi:hypothetical protein
LRVSPVRYPDRGALQRETAMQWTPLSLPRAKLRCGTRASSAVNGPVGQEMSVGHAEIAGVRQMRERDTNSRIVPVMTTQGEARERLPEESGLCGWQQQALDHWSREHSPETKKQRIRVNSATLSVMVRRAVAREKALAFRKPPRIPSVVMPERAAAWSARRQERS